MQTVIKHTFYTKYGKRALDIILSSFALVVLSPVILLEMLITLIELGRPIFFLQIRAGKDGKPFLIYKFRNMRNETDKNGVPLPPEQRVSKTGRFFRATSLDELPQFLNVLKGDMSIIGPRPLPMRYTEIYNERHRKRLDVLPGLECPIMDNEGYFDRSFHNQFENDVWYVEHVGFLTDIKVIYMLARLVFDRKSVKMRSTGGCGTFIGYKDGIAVTGALVGDDKGKLERDYWKRFNKQLDREHTYMSQYIPYPELRKIS